jgi:hypothetical protein
MMLGATYRFTIQNTTGQTLAANAVTIKPRRWKYGTDGSLTDESSGTADVLSQTATVANAAFKTGTTQDNTTAKYIGGFFEITVTAPASANGNVNIYAERSVDGGTTWPDNGSGEWVKTFSFTTSGTKRDTIEL